MHNPPYLCGGESEADGKLAVVTTIKAGFDFFVTVLNMKVLHGRYPDAISPQLLDQNLKNLFRIWLAKFGNVSPVKLLEIFFVLLMIILAVFVHLFYLFKIVNKGLNDRLRRLRCFTSTAKTNFLVPETNFRRSRRN